MYKKVCTRCTRSSFSSSEIGQWLCPSCGYDLTEAQFYKAATYHNIMQNVLPTRKKIEAYKKYSR